MGAAVDVTVVEARARVRVVYQLASVGSSVELEGIRFEGVELLDGRSGAGATPFEITHDDLGYSARVGVQPATETLLHLQYWVEVRRDASEIEVVVPVLVPRAIATDPRRDFFEGTIELPEGYRLVETFPSHSDRSEDGVRASLALPVVPGLLRVRAVSGSDGWGFIFWIELVALSLVGLLTWLGWRHLESEV